MAFGTRKVSGEALGSSEKKPVDYDAMNHLVVDTANLQQPETVQGYISSINDVGFQVQEDARLLWVGTENQEAEEIAKNPNTYFEDLKDNNDGGKIKRYKRFPQKPEQCVVLTIDFPEIVVDKGQFFGESNPAPLRLVLGGEFTPKGSKTNLAARPLSLQVRKNEKTNNQWSMPFNTTLYKMAVAAKLVKEGSPFTPQDIDKLLGQTLQFKVQVGFNKDGYYFDKCLFVAGLSRGQKPFEVDASLLTMTEFMEDNDELAIKNLRASIKNTMRKALDFDKSKIKDQIGEGYKKTESTEKSTTSKNDVDDSFDEDDSVDDSVPFDVDEDVDF